MKAPPLQAVDIGYDERRFGNSLVLAFSLHLIAIFGISFDFNRPVAHTSQLEISVSHFKSETKPEQADFLADTDQQGSGDLDDKRDLSTDNKTPFDERQQDRASELMIQHLQAEPVQREIVSRREADWQAASGEQQPEENNDEAFGADPMTVLDREIASLEARLDRQRQLLAKGPRVRRLTSLSTRRGENARYLRDWRDHIEAVGNRHYPPQAIAASIEGELRLLLALRPDGNIQEVRVLKSSGQPLLDRAALRIVHLAAPYKAFPPQMSAEVDILEIIRTWRFEQSRLSSH